MMSNWYIYVVTGLLSTIQYSIIPIFFGIIIGTIIVLMRMSSSKLLRYIAITYVSIIRGTPILLHLSIVYFVLPSVIKCDIPAFVAVVLAFSINSGAYVSEIIRAGINAIDQGQFDAARALAIPYRQMMRHIILPQAIRNIIPALINEAGALIKESSIVGIIGVQDVMRRAQVVAAEHYNYMEAYIVASLCYYVVVTLINTIGETIEKRLNAKSQKSH